MKMRDLKVGLCLVLAFAIGAAMSASKAAAAGPEWFECSEVTETGAWKNSTCSEADSTKKSNYERVTIVLAKFTALSHEVKFEASTDVITCKEEMLSGEIEEPGVAKNVKMKLFGCRGEETSSKKTCEVKSIAPAGGKEEIVAKTLKGELGKVSKSEAASEVGLLLAPESGTVFTEIEGSCLTIAKVALEGSLISEVTPVNKAQATGEVIDKASEKKQKIQKFEGGSQKVIKTTIFGIKFEVAFSSASKVTFEEAEIGAGEQVQARFVPFFAWKVNNFELQPTEAREVQELKATVAGITIEGKSGATLFKVSCTNMGEVGATKQILGGRPGKVEVTWEFSGCTMPVPANCAVENGKITTEALTGFIVQGVDMSSNSILIFFRPPTLGGTFMTIKAVNSGGACGLAGNITITGSVLGLALNRSEVFYPEFLFEPIVKSTFAWLSGAQIVRSPAGLRVGGEETKLSGTMFFAVKVVGNPTILTFSVT